MQRARLLEELGAGHVRHPLIHHEERERRAPALQLARGLERLPAGLRRDDAVVVAVLLAQVALNRTQHLAVVVHRQNHGLRHRVSGAAEGEGRHSDAGSVTQNSVPPFPVCRSMVP